MESKKEITKNLLANSFKKLILDIPFKNITIKMITDKSKVIRPTFYHHFKDKYEVLEYIVDEDIMKNIYEMVDSDMEYESLKIIFIRLEKNREFIKKAFKVEGQNSFKEILGYKIYNIFIRIIDYLYLDKYFYKKAFNLIFIYRKN